MATAGEVTNGEIARAFHLMADLLELDGAVRHRILAYRRAAVSVGGEERSVAELARTGRATELSGVGETLASKIGELVESGEIAALEKLAARIPRGLAAVARISGIGPARARALWQEAGVVDIAALRALAESNDDLTAVSGIGPRTADGIRSQLAALAAGEEPEPRVSIGRALPLAERLVADLRDHPAVQRAEIAGGLRRGAPTAKDVDIAVATDRPREVSQALADHPMVARVLSRGAQRCVVETHIGLPVELRLSPPGSFGNLLQHLTGSAAHNTRLRERAVKMGLSVSEHGITDGGGAVATHEDEEGVYAALGLAPIPPELRRDTDEIARAAAGTLPDLVTVTDIRGELHAHSTWSDGEAAISEMAAAAREAGLDYLAITDHSQSLGFAGGLTPEQVAEQWEEIAAVAERIGGLRLLRGTEVDILSDGRLDFDDELLARFDWVVASVHSRLDQSPERMTARLARAARHPAVDVIGHPTGRMHGRREEAEIDFEELFAAALEGGTALEINSSPLRMDLSAGRARAAAEAGVALTIGSDAHATGSFALLRYGVMVARGAGLGADQILNCRPWDELAATRRARVEAA